MSEVGLSVSSGDPVGGGGSGPGDGAWESSTGWDDWSLCVSVCWGLSMEIGSFRSRVRQVHASLMVEQEKACGARRWTLW